MKNQPTSKTVHKNSQSAPALPTFMDHVQELKGRLFWVAIFFVVAAGASYPFFQDIVDLLIRPLGSHELYYLSPAGGFSFVIKVCMYAGFIGALPVVIYHLYKFVAPVMQKERARTVIGFTIASTFLAAVGIVFAYIVSLPAALHFLTEINVKQITAMLTIDAYMSFIIAYLIAGALLFQLPLVMLIINSVTPLKPGQLMGYQRHIIIGSFVIAAVVSPTPDVVNQTLLAAPMVVMYQMGIIMIWAIGHRKARKAKNHGASHARTQSALVSTSGVSQPYREQPVLLQEMHPVSSHNTLSSPRPVSSQRPPALRRYADLPAQPRQLRRAVDPIATRTTVQYGFVASQTSVQPLAAATDASFQSRPQPTLDGFITSTI